MSVRSFLVGILSAGVLMGALAREAGAAEGVLIAPGRIEGAARAALLSGIESARASRPSAFGAVADLRASLPELDAQKRGRLAPIAPMLRALGGNGLFPMLTEMAVDARPRGDLTATAWTAWRVSLLEAVGSLRDPRAASVLAAILDSPETEFAVVRAAAEALGRLGTDPAAGKLIAMAKARGPKQQAVLAGMGDCRRTKVAEALAAALVAKPDEATVKVVVRSLGNVGSVWAWKTPVIAASGEEAATRRVAARALIGAFVAYEGELRKLATQAILVVDDPSTPALIEAEKKRSSAGLAADLDKLATRLSQNPLR